MTHGDDNDWHVLQNRSYFYIMFFSRECANTLVHRVLLDHWYKSCLRHSTISILAFYQKRRA